MPSKRWIIHTRPKRPTRRFPTPPPDTTNQSIPTPDQLPTRPAIYHCVSRVVDRRFIFGALEKDKFVEIMRIYEAFAGIRVLAHCVMTNHFHIMVEITPVPEGGINDGRLLNRLSFVYDEATVDAVEIELKNARNAISQNRATINRVEEIHERYTYRMHDLSEFMKSLIQRFTQWYNRKNERKGNLWEDAFRSVVVESGTAARLVAAYIDLNPVRAGIVDDPSDYPWSSYGEATNGAHTPEKPAPVNLRARGGLVRAFFAHHGLEADVTRWNDCHEIYRPWIEEAMAKTRASRAGEPPDPHTLESTGGALARRIRHFTDGVAIGGRDFIDGFFNEKRSRFGTKRKNGARLIRGNAARMAKQNGICSLRDLQNNLET